MNTLVIVSIVTGVVFGAIGAYVGIKTVRAAAAADREKVADAKAAAEEKKRQEIRTARAEATAEAEQRCSDRMEQKNATIADLIQDRNHERSRAESLQDRINEMLMSRGNGS